MKIKLYDKTMFEKLGFITLRIKLWDLSYAKSNRLLLDQILQRLDNLIIHCRVTYRYEVSRTTFE